VSDLKKTNPVFNYSVRKKSVGQQGDAPTMLRMCKQFQNNLLHNGRDVSGKTSEKDRVPRKKGPVTISTRPQVWSQGVPRPGCDLFWGESGGGASSGKEGKKSQNFGCKYLKKSFTRGARQESG